MNAAVMLELGMVGVVQLYPFMCMECLNYNNNWLAQLTITLTFSCKPPINYKPNT